MSSHELNVERVNMFINNNVNCQEDKVDFRSMFFYLIARKLQYLFIEDLNKIITLEDVMDDPGSEAFNLIKKVYEENKR